MKIITLLLFLILVWEGSVDSSRFRILQIHDVSVIERETLETGDSGKAYWQPIDQDSADCSLIWKEAAFYWRRKALEASILEDIGQINKQGR